MEESKDISHLDESCESELNNLKPAASSHYTSQPPSPSSATEPHSPSCQTPPPGWEKPISHPALTKSHLFPAPPPSVDHISSPLRESESSDTKSLNSVSAHSPSLPLPSATLPHVPYLSADSPILEKPRSPSMSPYSPMLPISPASTSHPSSPLQESFSAILPISATMPSDIVPQSTFLSRDSVLCKNLTSCSLSLPSQPSEPQQRQTQLSFPERKTSPLVWENQKSPSTSSLDSSLLPAIPPSPHVCSPLKESSPPCWENPKSPSMLLHSVSHDMPLHDLPPSHSSLHDSAPPGWENSKPEVLLLPPSASMPQPLPPSPHACSPPPGWENPKSPSMTIDSPSHNMPLHELPLSDSTLDDSAPPGWENIKPEDLPPPPSASLPQPPPPNLQPPAYSISDAEMGQLVCGSCHGLISYPRSSTLIQCPCCQTINYVLEEHQVGNVKCEKCSVLLMYPYGAPSVRCSCCHFVTKIGLHNRRPPLSVQQRRHLEPQNCA